MTLFKKLWRYPRRKDKEYFNEYLSADLPRRFSALQKAQEKQEEYLRSVLTEEQLFELRRLGQEVVFAKNEYEFAIKK